METSGTVFGMQMQEAASLLSLVYNVKHETEENLVCSDINVCIEIMVMISMQIFFCTLGYKKIFFGSCPYFLTELGLFCTAGSKNDPFFLIRFLF